MVYIYIYIYIDFSICNKANFYLFVMNVKLSLSHQVKKTDAGCLRTWGFRPKRGIGRKMKFS
jgi:hypothetical protein